MLSIFLCTILLLLVMVFEVVLPALPYIIVILIVVGAVKKILS